MGKEYIILNKSIVEKKIDELEKSKKWLSPDIDSSDYYGLESKINLLKGLLSQSTPLIPEIEKAFDDGCKYGDSNCETGGNSKLPNKQDYISNLKLDI